jgi:glycerol-3-phosphate acyltransferase PlsX
MKIAIDLMGGEGCGEQNLEGCLAYPYPEELIVIGDLVRLDQQKINSLVERGTQLRPCAAALTGNESPRALLKRSHDSSLAIGMQMLADRKTDALVSSADTKAMMVLGRSVLGTVAGLYRPAIAKAFQGPRGQFYMLDLGANVHCSPDLLRQFGRLGSALQSTHQLPAAAATEDIGAGPDATPRVGLLNIGVERGKGTGDINRAISLFEQDKCINCIGFIEPSELFSGRADVIVCDGYTGNLVLKTIESMAGFLRGQLTDLANETDYGELSAQIDADRYNGALFAGLNGVVVKSHGSASKRGFAHAILQGREYVASQLPMACEQMLARE